MRRRVLRSTLRRLLFLAVMVFAQFVPDEKVQPQTEPKHVLVLYSTRRDGEFSIIGENELPRLLDVGLARNLDYYSEFIDVSRFPDPSYRTAFRDFLRLKYQGVRFDLVIAMQNVAVAFVSENRNSLFSEMPIVVLTNDPGWARFPNATGLIQPRNYIGNLALMRQLQPDVQNVFVITGAAAADKEYENAVRSQVQSSGSPLNVTYLSGLSTSDLEGRLSQLPEHSAVYYVLVTEDGAGNKFHPLEYIDRVAAAANAPTYSWVDSAIGHGILGGNLYTQKPAIDRVGEVALRVLAGEAADTIPVSVLDLNVNQVDWRQLQRWGIDEARVPAGTIIAFRDASLWQQYRTYILAAVIIFLTQTALIGGLLLQRRMRRQAEAQLRNSHQRNRDLGSRLLKARETEQARIARELHGDICQRMLLLTIELESVKRASADEGAATEALSIAQEVSKSLHELSHRLHPTRLRLIGLAGALDQLRYDVSRAGLHVAFTHENVPSTLEPEVMLCLFRVAQEALQNAIKHSGATEVSMRLAAGPTGLSLEITDNGLGFDVEAAWNKGVGLVSMTERMEACGGSLEIRSTAGAGTSVTARIPAHIMQRMGRLVA